MWKWCKLFVSSFSSLFRLNSRLFSLEKRHSHSGYGYKKSSMGRVYDADMMLETLSTHQPTNQPHSHIPRIKRKKFHSPFFGRKYKKCGRWKRKPRLRIIIIIFLFFSKEPPLSNSDRKEKVWLDKIVSLFWMAATKYQGVVGWMHTLRRFTVYSCSIKIPRWKKWNIYDMQYKVHFLLFPLFLFNTTVAS